MKEGVFNGLLEKKKKWMSTNNHPQAKNFENFTMNQT
jgi:hypothetical protein